MTRQEAQFPTTRWTLVLGAGTEELRGEAARWLCEQYWQPLYAFLRRRGYEPGQAQDLTQGFLTRFLEKRSIESADPERGRFRSYLLGALKYFLADAQDYHGAAMRGGGVAFVPLGAEGVEERYLETPAHLSPEALYERQWALAVIERVLGLMRAEHESGGRLEQFEALKGFLTGEGDTAEAAAALGMNEGAVRVAAHRLRRRYRDLLVAEIAQTVESEEEVQREIRHLIAAIAG